MNLENINHILITNGQAKEVLDQIRLFTNVGSPDRELGVAFATHLLSQELYQGKITLISTCSSDVVIPTYLRNHPNVQVIDHWENGNKILSTEDILEQVNIAMEKIDNGMIFHLANLMEFKPLSINESKLKLKESSETSFQIVKNDRLPEFDKPTWGFQPDKTIFHNLLEEGNLFHDLIRELEQDIKIAREENDIIQRKSPNILENGDGDDDMMKDKRVLITGGPTWSYVDNMGNVMTNFSSGAQSWEITKAFLQSGALVTLVLGGTGDKSYKGKHLFHHQNFLLVYNVVLHSIQKPF